MKYLKKYEDAEEVIDIKQDVRTHYDDDDARAFGYDYKESLYDDYYDEGDNEDLSLDEYAGSRNIYPTEMKVGSQPSDYHMHITTSQDRSTLMYPGRLWLEQKVIAFGFFPPVEELNDVLEDIAGMLNYKNGEKVDWSDGWKIETVDRKKGYLSVYVVDLNEYRGSDKWSKETLMKLHTLAPEEKQAIMRQLGYSGKRIKTPKGMSEAEYRNKKTRYKYTESKI